MAQHVPLITRSTLESKETVVVRSSDNVDFVVHRIALELNTGAFPSAEFKTNNEIVTLSESANTLKILFNFIYPNRHPTLEDLSFEDIAEVAEAAEKYEVFAAMNIACVRLSEFLPCNAEHILAHGIKHDYTQLIDEAAECAARAPLPTIVEAIPTFAVNPWVLYQQAWDDAFSNACRQLSRLSSSVECTTPEKAALKAPGKLSTGSICDRCYCTLKAWIFSLTKIEKSIADVQSAISLPVMDRKVVSKGRVSYCSSCTGDCVHLKKLQLSLQKSIERLPPFTKFLSPNPTESD